MKTSALNVIVDGEVLHWSAFAKGGEWMSTVLEPSNRPSADSRDDASLLLATRDGDLEAYGLLFERHRLAAQRLALSLTTPANADDLVSEAFAKVLASLQNGNGPTEFFRAYLLTAVRSLHVDSIRREAREVPSEDSRLDTAEEFLDTAQIGFERTATAEAFASLPERWQYVLWHLDVEKEKPAAIAPNLGMTANAVSALAYRAREGLKQAYIQGHVRQAATPDCSDTIGSLGSYVRKGLSRRDRAKVDAHLDDCRSCTGLVLELQEYNETIGASLAAALLGVAALGYTATTGATALSLAAVSTNSCGKNSSASSATGTAAASGTALAGVGMVAIPLVVAASMVAAVSVGYLALNRGDENSPSKPVAVAPVSPSSPDLPRTDEGDVEHDAAAPVDPVAVSFNQTATVPLVSGPPDPPPAVKPPVTPTVDPVKPPIEPHVEPVEPTEPVDPPIDPVEPVDPPIDPVEPVDPPIDPVEPVDPPIDPVEPVAPPIDPVEPGFTTESCTLTPLEWALQQLLSREGPTLSELITKYRELYAEYCNNPA